MGTMTGLVTGNPDFSENPTPAQFGVKVLTAHYEPLPKPSPKIERAIGFIRETMG
jgi:hypothetical protein